MRVRNRRTVAAVLAAGLLVGGLGGGFALAAGTSGSSMHEGDAMHSSSQHGAAMSHDPEMPSQGAAMSHGAAMHEASLTG